MFNQRTFEFPRGFSVRLVDYKCALELAFRHASGAASGERIYLSDPPAVVAEKLERLAHFIRGSDFSGDFSGTPAGREGNTA